MLPLYDTIPVKSRVHVNWLFIIINMMVMAVVLSQSSLEKLSAFYHFGFIPAHILQSPFAPLTIITSSFFHLNLFHFLGNMLFLWIFGNNIEGLMGSWRYLVFYTLGGIVAACLHILTHIHSVKPVIGASGSIAAIMGAYFLYFPYSKIYTLIPFRVIKLPAQIYLGIWFVFQVIPGIQNIVSTNNSNVSITAWWSHIGGFVFGYLAARYFTQGKQPPKSGKQKYSRNILFDLVDMFSGKSNS